MIQLDILADRMLTLACEISGKYKGGDSCRVKENNVLQHNELRRYELAQDNIHWQSFVNIVLKFGYPK
jgi:hypothetical protein